jgi:MYXO-CTERM domain-containing protein
MTVRAVCVAAIFASGSAPAATKTFSFAEVGTSYTGFLFPDDPFNGRQVVLTRIYLTLTVPEGSDAAFFDTDITVPLEPGDGSTNLLALTGESLGWSGSGVFTTFIETTGFNGTFYSTLYGAATSPLDGAFISEDSRVEMETVPGPGAVALLGVALVPALRRRRAQQPALKALT